MLGDLQAVLVNVISNIAWLPIWALLAALGYFIQIRLPRRRLWRLANPSRLVICAATSKITYTGEYHRPVTGIGQVRALALAVKSLSRAYGNRLDISNVLLSEEPLQERLEQDLLLLGGPKNNQVTDHFLELMQDRQPVIQLANPDKIIWREKKLRDRWIIDEAIEFSSQVDRKKVVLDYGLIMCVESPFTSRNNAVVLLSGSHTYGLVAAAKFFTEDMKGLHWMKHLKHKNLVAVVSARILDGQPTKMKLERLYTW